MTLRRMEGTTQAKIIPWAAYLLHQFGKWYLMRSAQLARDRGGIAWPTTLHEQSDAPLSESDKVAALAPNRYAKLMFALNLSMVLLKFFQAQLLYDGLASDVPELSALYSVALWILFVMIVEMPRRGLAFG